LRIGLNRAGKLAGIGNWTGAAPGAPARLKARPVGRVVAGDLIGVLQRNLAAEDDRFFSWYVAGFAAGITAYFALADEPSLLLAGMLALGALVTLAVTRHLSLALRFLIALAVAAGLGFAAAKWRAESAQGPAILRDTGPVTADGRIESVDILAPGRARISFEPLRIANGGGPVPSRLRLTVRGEDAVSSLKPGAWVSLRAVLRPPPEPAMPHGYDFARWAYFQGIGGVGFVLGAPKPMDAPREASLAETIRTYVETLRLGMAAHIRQSIAGPEGNIAAALITGERGAIGGQDEAAYRDSGLAHVLSISGLHMALAGLGIFWVIRALLALSPLLALTRPIKKWAAAAAILSASFYLVLSGAGAPAVRSFLMLTAMLVGVMADRPLLSMRAVAMAALAILAFRPEEIVNPGFQMSFAAVVGLIALAEWSALRPRNDVVPILGIPRKARRYFGGLLAASLVATVATTPLAIYHFDRAGSYALLGNLLAEPVVAFVIMPAAAFSVVLMPFGLDTAPLLVMGWGIRQMTQIAHFVAALPGASLSLRAWPDVGILAIAFGGLWIGLWRRSWRWFGIVPAAIGFWTIALSSPPDILIARDGTAAAIRQADGRLAILGVKPDDYTAAQWLLRDGDSRSVEEARKGVSCDFEGCAARLADGRLAVLALRQSGLPEDCSRAAVLISAIAVRGSCEGPLIVIDRFDIGRSGAMAVSFAGGKPLIETVAAARRNRIWANRSRRAQ
jgi:competence protein ComEC